MAAACIIAGEVVAGTARTVAVRLARGWRVLVRDERWPVVRRRSAHSVVVLWVTAWMAATLLMRNLRRLDSALAVASVAVDVRVGSTVSAGVRWAAASLGAFGEATSNRRRWSRRLRLAEVDAPPAPPGRVVARVGAVVCGAAVVVAAGLAACGVALRFAVGHAGQSLVLDSQAVTLPPLPQRSVVFASDRSPKIGRAHV